MWVLKEPTRAIGILAHGDVRQGALNSLVGHNIDGRFGVAAVQTFSFIEGRLLSSVDPEQNVLNALRGIAARLDVALPEPSSLICEA